MSLNWDKIGNSSQLTTMVLAILLIITASPTGAAWLPAWVPEAIMAAAALSCTILTASIIALIWQSWGPRP